MAEQLTRDLTPEQINRAILILLEKATTQDSTTSTTLPLQTGWTWKDAQPKYADQLVYPEDKVKALFQHLHQAYEKMTPQGRDYHDVVTTLALASHWVTLDETTRGYDT